MFFVTVQPKGSVSIAGFAATDAKGNYSLNYKGSADSITITVAGMNIGKHTKTVSARSQKMDFVIDETPLELKEVNVTAPKIKLWGDTLDYQVEAFTYPNDRVIGDVLKKMPGIEVAPSGKISYQGKDINGFYFAIHLYISEMVQKSSFCSNEKYFLNSCIFEK
jgi:hypothetical protein